MVTNANVTTMTEDGQEIDDYNVESKLARLVTQGEVHGANLDKLRTKAAGKSRVV